MTALFKKSALIFLLLFTFAFAATEKTDEILGQINQKNQEVEKIEKEIRQYQEEIDKTQKEERTLENQIHEFQATTNKLTSEIKLTEKKIQNANLTIEKLDIEVENKNKQISDSKKTLSEIIRKLDEEESQTLLEILLAHNSLSEFFNDIERMEYLQKDIIVNLDELRNLKNQLEDNQSEKKEEKNKHQELSSRLGDQKELVTISKNKKKNLLTQTQNKEENFKKVLEEKTAKRDTFLEELSELEALLKIEIDPTKIPDPRPGFLKWPLDDISLESCWGKGETAKNCVTQFFGNTPFATKNPQVYGGKGHNGIDFRASIGEPLKAALGGVVQEVGNTDTIPGCYSYGKWVLIDHLNGLSSLYAHLSLIKVKKGQEVKTRELIGYSGTTGYSTGPHLHFTVYATQGLKIVRLGDIKKITNCADARIPVADKEAYLNPLSYLAP